MKYTLEYDDIYENMSLNIKRSILHRRNKMGPQLHYYRKI